MTRRRPQWRRTRFFYLILIGIVCTVFADWLLAPAENERNFAAGLAAFLIGYLLYGIALLVRVAATASGSGAGASVGVVAIVYLLAAAVSAARYLSLTKVASGFTGSGYRLRRDRGKPSGGGYTERDRRGRRRLRRCRGGDDAPRRDRGDLHIR